MVYRALSILLCSCLLAGSVPHISYGAEAMSAAQGIEKSIEKDNIAQAEGISLQSEGGASEEIQEEPEREPEPAPEPEPEPAPEPEPEPAPEPAPEPEPPSSEPPAATEEQPSSEEPSSSQETSATEESSSSQETSTTEESSSSEESTTTEESSSSEETSSTQESSSSEESTTTEESSSSEESSSTEESSSIKFTEVETTEEETTEETETETETETTEEETTEEETTEEETLPENTSELKYASVEEVLLKANDSKWYQFAASESGYYNFYINGSSVSDVSLSVYDMRKDGKQLKSQTYRSNVRYAVVYLEKDQIVYPRLTLAENGPAMSKTILFGVKRVKTASVEAVEGGYTVNAGSFTASIGWRTASRTLSVDMTLSPKDGRNLDGSYIWQIKYGNGELGYQYIEEQITPGTKKEKNINALDAGAEYSFSMYLLNADTYALEAVLVPDGGAIKMQTGSSRDNIIFRGKNAGYDSITLEFEAVEPIAKYSYGALAAYEDEITVQRYISGVSSITVSGLEPATTYYFEFYNSSGVVFGYTTVDTKEYPAKVNYSARAAGPDSLLLKADISSFTGRIPEYFNLCYEAADAEGRMVASGMEKVSAKGSEKWTIEAQVSDLDHSTPYSVTMWINEPGYSAHFREKTLSVKTGSSPFPDEALTVDIRQNAQNPARADYTVNIESFTENVTGKLKYRMKDSLGEYEIRVLNIRNGVTKGSVTNLQEGAEYEYEVRVAGVVKRGTFKMGDARINPEMTDDTDAYDSIVSYRLKPSELTQGAAYSVKLYYYNDETKLYAEIASKLALSTENDYTVSAQAADYFSLSPETRYGFKWELYSGSTLVNTQYQLINTRQSKATVALTANMADYVTYSVKIDGRTENISRDITLFSYICEEGGEYRKEGSSFNLYASKSYKSDGRMLTGLEDEKTYTVSFRDIKGKEYGSYTFTFEAKIDGVRVSVGNQVAGAHNLTIQTKIEGEIAPESYLILFFKEKDEEDWDIRSVPLEDEQTECNFELTSYLGDDVNSDTIYEYVSGISSEKYPPATAALAGACSGEMLTQTDGRNLTNVSAGSGYSYISIKAMLTNNPINTTSYIYVFYREKGQKEWLKSQKSFIISNTTGGMLTFINDLKPGTEYEYIVAVSDIGFDVSLNDIEQDRQIAGSVMTRNDEFALDISESEDAFVIKAETNAQAKSIKAVLTLDDGQTKEVMLSKSRDYSNTLSFDDLPSDKSHAVTAAELKVMETITGKCSYVTVASFEPQDQIAVNR